MKHLIKGKTCEIKIDIPGSWDKETKNLITKIMEYCLEEEKRIEVINSLNRLNESEENLLNSLKQIDEYKGEFEKTMREFIGMNLNHGFEIGSNYMLTSEAKAEILTQVEEYQKILEKMAFDNMYWVCVLYGLYLGRLSYEMGFMLGTSISAERVEEYREEIRKEMSYVG
jgi:hypothetical protein